MSTLFLAAIVSLVGVAPLLLGKRFGTAAIVGTISCALLWLMGYLGLPSLVWPLGGAYGFWLVVLWLLGWAIGVADNNKNVGTITSGIAGIVGLVIFLGAAIGGCGALRHSEYRGMIGPVEERTWTQDVQPKDPKHVRLVPMELARWLADKQLGEVKEGAIGSQFEVDKSHMTLQMIKGELWYVAPLDYRSYSVWSSTNGAPGYVMVHGEDPLHPVKVVTGKQFVYMPGAFFSQNLERHLWNGGYWSKGLTDYSFEIDDQGKEWWVVTVFEPTILFFGKKATGVAIVDPTTGEHTFHPMGKVPEWVDRAVPDDFVENYLVWRGKYNNGWFNSWWGKKNITEPESPSIIYGSDGQPYWVTGITSNNGKDESLVGVMYTNSRTGKSTYYQASGGTETAVITTVNNKVSYRKLHGAGPVLYNILGTMAYIVPLLGESHTPQGVAFVNVQTMQIAVGDDQHIAFREYQKLIALSGQQVAPDAAHTRASIEGIVDRFVSEVRGGETTHYLHIAGVNKIFTGGSELSPKLPLTKAGDRITLTFIESEQDVLLMLSFDNKSLPLKASADQKNIRQRSGERKEGVSDEKEADTAREKIKNMSDEEIRKLMKKKGK